MEPATYIYERQLLWARRHGISLQGSDGERGRPAYTSILDKNLFQPLTEATRQDFLNGDGGELKGSPCRLQAIHSSAALACNLFDYWRSRGEVVPIARACGLPITGLVNDSLRFEGQFPIAADIDRDRFPRDPNIDAVFRYAPNRPINVVGVESKFGEAYDTHPGISSAYLDKATLWPDLPRCRELAGRISPNDREFRFLHAAQLLKHILGLKHACNGVAGFTLLYLWYDALGVPGAIHRTEIERFSAVAKQDGINFRAITYQEVVVNLGRHERNTHEKYVDYIAERYL